MGANDPPGHGQFRPQGLHWQDLCRGPLNIATTKYLSCRPLSFREKDFLNFFFHYKSMGANDPLRSGHFGPQGHGWKHYCRRPPHT